MTMRSLCCDRYVESWDDRLSPCAKVVEILAKLFCQAFGGNSRSATAAPAASRFLMHRAQPYARGTNQGLLPSPLGLAFRRTMLILVGITRPLLASRLTRRSQIGTRVPTGKVS